MKIGHMFLVPGYDASVSFQERYDTTMRIIEYSSGRGWDGIWFTEHHFSDYGYTPNPIVFLAAASRLAPDMRLGTAVLVLPLWNPVRAAEDIALLDVLSGGRVDVGVGRGYQPYEFERLDADITHNRDAFNESLKIMVDAWTKDEFEHDGRAYQIGPTTVFPRPLQDPHPPIWMAATTPPSIRTAVQGGYHLMTGTGAVFEELAQRDAYIDTLLEELGRPAESVERATNRFVFCSNSRDDIDFVTERSRDQVRVSRVLSSGTPPIKGRNTPKAYAGEPDLEAWRRRMVIGTPDECLEQLQGLADAGITYLNAMVDFGGLPERLVMSSMRLFTEEVLPTAAGIRKRSLTDDERIHESDAYLERGSYYQGV